jgi:hypothetical protein
MLRLQGVPARVVSGYAPGVFDEENKSYRVRASNAHTWVDVYFPQYGWIQFEPTASIPVVDRPEHINESGGDAFGAFTQRQLDREALLGEDLGSGGAANPSATNLPEETNVGTAAITTTFPIWQAIGATLVLALAIGLSMLANQMNRRVESDVDRSYKRLGGWARWLGLVERPVDTPYERADQLAAAVPAGKEPIRALTRQFVLKQFSAAKRYDEGFDPLPLWQQLRPLLLRQGIVRRLQKWQERSRRPRRRSLFR